MKTNMLHVVNPSVFPCVTFVTAYEFEEPKAAASSQALETQSAVRGESKQRNWTRAVSHLQTVVNRLVRESLWRKAPKPAAVA